MMMMRQEEEESEEDELNIPPPSTPPADLRCNRYDGKGWHCKGWRLQDMRYCQKHYFEYRSNKEKNKKKSNGEVGKKNLKEKFDLDDGGIKRVKKNEVGSENGEEICVNLKEKFEIDSKEKKIKRFGDVGRQNLKEKFDLDDGVIEKVKKNGVGEEGRNRVIVLALGFVDKKAKFDLDGSVGNGEKRSGVDCEHGGKLGKIEMIPLKGCDNKRRKSNLAVPEKKKTDPGRSRRSSVGGAQRNYREEIDEEEEGVEKIRVKKRKRIDLDSGGGNTMVNDSSGRKRGRGRPRKVKGMSNVVKGNGVGSEEGSQIEVTLSKGCDDKKETTDLVVEAVNGVQEVEMTTVKESDKKKVAFDFDVGGGDTMVNEFSKGKKRGRGRPKKVEGVSNGMKENGVGSKEGSQIEISLSKGFDDENEKFDLGVEAVNVVQKVEMTTVKVSDKKRDHNDHDVGGGGDTMVNDFSTERKRGRGRPKKVDSSSDGMKANKVGSEEGGQMELNLLSKCDNKKETTDLVVEAVNGVDYNKEEVEMNAVQKSDKKRGKNDLDNGGCGGDTLVNDSSKVQKRGRGRPKKVEGISNEMKESTVESAEGGQTHKILSKGCDNKKEKFDVVVEAVNADDYSKEEAEMISVKKSGGNDLDGGNGDTLVNDFSKEKKRGRGRPRKVEDISNGLKENEVGSEEGGKISTGCENKKENFGGGGGDTLLNDSSTGIKRGRGRPKKVEGISNEMKENGVGSEEGGKLSMGCDNNKDNFDLVVEDANGVEDEAMLKMEAVPEREKPEHSQSKSSNVVGLNRTYREGEEVEMIAVEESDKNREKNDHDTVANDSPMGITWGRPVKVDGEPLKEFEPIKSTSRSKSQMRHWLIVKREKELEMMRELEMKTAVKCGTMSTVGENENLTTENENIEVEKIEDCNKRFDLNDGGATVVKDSSNVVISKAELLKESEDKLNDFAGGSEKILADSEGQISKSNDEPLSADENGTLK